MHPISICVLKSAFPSHFSARKAAAGLYRPLLVGINVLYSFVRYYLKGSLLPPDVLGWLGLICIAGLQLFAYMGIMDDASKPRAASDKRLVGGVSLDVLLLTVVIQFLAVLWSSKTYWLLLLFPLWGAYSLYHTFGSGSGRGAAGAGSNGSRASAVSGSRAVDSEELAERRQKRAERRRQKRT